MSVSLRDFFAAHVAAALVNRADSPSALARHAFDVADALCAERRLRDELAALEDAFGEQGVRTVRPSDARASGNLTATQLLDDPMPLEEETDLEDRDDAASLEAEELAMLAARDDEERADALAMIASAGYVPAWDPSWDDRADMTDWDRDAHWEHAVGVTPRERRPSDRPGLARTVPEQMELRLGEGTPRKTGSS